ncbi:MAG: hypothetical protein K8S87_11945 [Planctomycetes bacterium]|nr:hypothetical protein [Planctomycetota bacterium]
MRYDEIIEKNKTTHESPTSQEKKLQFLDKYACSGIVIIWGGCNENTKADSGDIRYIEKGRFYQGFQLRSSPQY